MSSTYQAVPGHLHDRFSAISALIHDLLAFAYPNQTTTGPMQLAATGVRRLLEQARDAAARCELPQAAELTLCAQGMWWVMYETLCTSRRPGNVVAMQAGGEYTEQMRQAMLHQAELSERGFTISEALLDLAESLHLPTFNRIWRGVDSAEGQA